MAEINSLINYLKTANASNVIIRLIALVGCGNIIYTFGIKLYNYIKGVESKDLQLQKHEDAITEIMKQHENDIAGLMKQHEEDISELKEFIQALSQAFYDEKKSAQKVDCALLRDRIITAFRYHKRKGKINALDKENMDEMFKQYFDRNGNHLISDIYQEFKKIEVDYNTESH